MRPSADVGQSAGERRAGGFIFPDSEDSRPSPNIPRDGNPRSVRNEQSEQQRILIDWDAASGLHDSDEFAYSAYLDLTSSGARSLEQNRGFHELLMKSTYFRADDLQARERDTVTEVVDSRWGLLEGRTPAEYRLPRVYISIYIYIFIYLFICLLVFLYLCVLFRFCCFELCF